MSYPCPNCGFGTLQPITTTYLRWWGKAWVTIPNFAAWCCDSCQFTRYDSAALAQLELVLGPDLESWVGSPPWRTRATQGPDERGPQRRSY
jgi:YgiT-type zinc finger domain-containing protein